MKRLLWLMVLLCLGTALFAVPAPKDEERKAVYEAGKKLEGIFPCPHSTSGSPVILLLGGGRPWQATGLGGSLIQAGADVNVLSGPYLAGLSGSFIRSLPHQKEEPKAVDAITPEFKHLDEYDMVFINAIPEKNQQKIFHETNLEYLKRFLNNGGTLFLTIGAPNETLAEILPVELGKRVAPGDGLYVRTPDTPNFASLPREFQVVDPYREVKLKQGAQVLSPIVDGQGAEKGVFAVMGNYGKGRVLFLNAEKLRGSGAYCFDNWAYSSAYVVGLTAELSGKPLIPVIKKRQGTVPPKEIGKVKISVAQPVMELTSVAKAPKIRKGQTCFLFANGVQVIRKENDCLDVYLPRHKTPFAVNVQIPSLQLSKKQMVIEDASAEAVGMKDALDATKISWSLEAVKTDPREGSVILQWKGNEGTLLEQELKSADLALDAVNYRGFAMRARVVKTPYMISGIGFQMQVDVAATKMRRMACYQPPRGYAEFDMTEKQKIDSRPWGIFSDGQPFSWLEGKRGVFVSFTGGVRNTASCQMSREANETLVTLQMKAGFGFQSAPMESDYFYYMVGDPSAADNNGWMAMYQFQRHNLRKIAGFQEMPAYPNATWQFGSSTSAQRERTIANIGKVGIRYVYMPYCPSCMDDIDSPERLEMIKKVVAAGSRPFAWSPCGHSHGSSEWLEKQTDWYAYTPEGEPFKYFGGNFPVIDQGNPEFLNWYLPKVQRAIDAGLAGFWFDMGGSATGTRNFAKPNSPIGLENLVKHIYPKFYTQGGFLAIEGQSPLLLEGFWYRADKYTPMQGKEFAFIGDMVYADGFDFDFIRSSMYGTFYTVPFIDYGTKFECLPGELKQLDDIVHYVPVVNRALDVAGMPFIRETSFGTSWIGANGGALFFYDGVKKLKVSLPRGMRPVLLLGETGEPVQLNGKMPKSVAPRSILLFERKCFQKTVLPDKK